MAAEIISGGMSPEGFPHRGWRRQPCLPPCWSRGLSFGSPPPLLTTLPNPASLFSSSLCGGKERREDLARAPALLRADIQMGGGAHHPRREGEHKNALRLGAPHHGF